MCSKNSQYYFAYRAEMSGMAEQIGKDQDQADYPY